MRQRVMYKTAMLTYKSLNIGQPEHLSVLLSDYTPLRQLRSSDHQLLSQPTDNTVFAGRAFSSTAPRVWNSLPITIRTASITNTFRRHHKTHLFSGNTAIDKLLPSAPTIRTCVLTYGALQMQTTYLLTYLLLVIISSMSVPICNRFHATRDNFAKKTLSRGVIVFDARLRRAP